MRFNQRGESESYYVTLLFACDAATRETARAQGAIDDNDADADADDDGTRVAIVSNTKAPTVIEVTRDPLQETVEHNQGTSKHRFTSKSSGALCKMQQIIGPIDTLEEALHIQKQWKNNSRGLVGRGAEARALAAKHELPCFDWHHDAVYEKTSTRAPRRKPQAAAAKE